MTLGARAKRAIYSGIAGALILALALLEPALTLARARPPEIGARAAVLVDGRDGYVLYARHPRQRRPIASTTKLMTALLALERFPLRKRLRAAPYQAAEAESRIDLRPGERISVGDLLRALLLESANDAAVTLARGAAGSVESFVDDMNERVRALGLADTHYANPIGLDESGNYSSALDLSRLARRLLGNAAFAEIVDLPRARLGTGARPRVVDNRNDLVARVPWIDGVKTGHTLNAGYVLVGAGTRKGVQLVSVVLGDGSEAARDADTLALLRYGFRAYRQVRVVRAGAEIGSAAVKHFGGRLVKLVAGSGARVTVRRDQRLRTRLNASLQLEGPLPAGAKVGAVKLLLDGKPVKVVPVVTAEPVPKAGFFRKLGEKSILPVLVVVAALIAVGRRRRKAGGGRRGVLT
jgi:serine-type D-Ala-D-Ala carboxypeptidase (penicillin-binding protein 5/6)